MSDKTNEGKEPGEGALVKIEIDSHEEKEVFWHPEKLREEIKNKWPEQVRKDAGFELGRVPTRA